MPKFYFTFGCGQEHDHHVQPIIAKDMSVARAKMIEMYGTSWSWAYTEEEWEEIRNRPSRCWPMETEMEEVTVND